MVHGADIWCSETPKLLTEAIKTKKRGTLNYGRFWLKIFYKKNFGLSFPPILAEFNAPIGFCLRQPRLDLYSFSSYFELFPDLTNFLDKNFEIFSA
jgi:hypothetical protein